MTTDITELAQMKGQKVEGSYYLAECTNCGKMYPSNKLNGGEPLFSGDYGQCYCLHCNADDADVADWGAHGSDVVTAWNYQQDRIDALVEALEKAQAKNALVAGGIEAAAKLHERIAELESRTVTAESMQESAYRAGLTAGWNLGLSNNNDGFNKCLSAHGAGINREDE